MIYDIFKALGYGLGLSKLKYKKYCESLIYVLIYKYTSHTSITPVPRRPSPLYEFSNMTSWDKVYVWMKKNLRKIYDVKNIYTQLQTYIKIYTMVICMNVCPITDAFCSQTVSCKVWFL